MLYVVGKHVAEVEEGSVWELQGVFTEEALALNVCEGHPDYFIGPVPENSPMPDSAMEWPDCKYANGRGPAVFPWLLSE